MSSGELTAEQLSVRGGSILKSRLAVSEEAGIK